MRVTFGTKYNQISGSQDSLQSRLNELNAKIASGKKIQHSYEDSRVYNKDLQLGYQETTLQQNIDVARNAYNNTINSDKALQELSKAILDFNTKLLQVANQPQSPTSRAAIANELAVLKAHMMNIANTSIGGEYLFGGTKIKNPPIGQDGQYKGNNQKLEAVIGPNVMIPYNIPGSDLFLGNDKDYSTSVTGNIKKYNQSKLHPNIMDKLNKDEVPTEVFIKSTDTLRDLMGDNDDITSNDEPMTFYLRGIRPDGSRFKSKFTLEQSYISPDNATKVSDLLDRIGREFGNNQASKVVDVTLNPWGEIEIKSLVDGSSNLSFNLIASNKDVDDVSTLPTLGAKVISFQKSPYISNKQISSIQSLLDTYKQYQVEIPVTFISQKTKVPANSNTDLSEIFDSEIFSIHFDGQFKDEDKKPQVLTFNTKDAKIIDVLKDIETFYQNNGYNVQAEIANGKLLIIDLDAKKNNVASKINLTLSTADKNNFLTNGIKTDFHNTYDDVFFEKHGSKLTSNISQVILGKDGYATDETRLIDVAGNLEGKTYTLHLKDHNGVEVKAKMLFEKAGCYLVLPSKDSTPQNLKEYKIPIVNLNEKGKASIARPENISYRQLMDTLAIALNYSNQDEARYQKLLNNPENYSVEQKELYEEISTQAASRIEIMLNENGQIEIHDRTRSMSNMEFSMSDTQSDDFSQESIRETENGLLLHANNALTIDKPQINFFDSLDVAIKAVRDGIYRPDEFPTSYNSNMRNIGIQNSLNALKHLGDHVEKMIALNGSYGKSFESSITKNEVLMNQVQSLRGENIGADIAEAYNKFSNLSTNYDAVLNSSSKIHKMSILDYV
ncbi:flagellar hook-associated protein FlgL [Helicobacter cholecystus]|uniref:Flagellar hook-associated protein FlgL n=1 Tax=Helicobacter cholecystus TaxID=45498 RepID=A0A3D8ITU4_9HELI|nr:flagellar hook-associated protein FlgL [Helicobacter cholecystus]RDU68709.1 flagellar hook-associated protein FlgL [Helicobacter cholecystus]VEJ26175.1 flagellar hook-associated protein [Helicobacter cholecystus]